MAEENQDRQITITITDNAVRYETDLHPSDMVFWLEAVKSMVLEKSFNPEAEA